MLYQLQEKLSVLIKQYNFVKQQSEQLSEKVVALEDIVALQKERLKELEEELMIKRMGDSGDQQALIKYIDSIIREIDNTIKNL
jgi:chromosome segregation ATPase